ncbi:hypothetical protein ACFQ3R_06000 [Mesonia ostreae]|uniref:Uncharacterized protein n=1 Tax=Mesonia ostreae TaxID=861110 RepID=A0ABU2KHB9_9FLAO|nr:hypothetical protein [Mesonia ostreae]MDT0294107.1 hypothetical protein [Mesonia ostreae]
MKTRKKANNMFRVFLSLLFIIAIVCTTEAQIPLPGDDSDVPDVPGAPIDAFIGMAIAVGAYFGAKKLRGSKKEN